VCLLHSRFVEDHPILILDDRSIISEVVLSHVYQIHLNYELMHDELREIRESVNVFNAQIQAFMAVRNKNTFIAFLTFSDTYVCFTIFTLQVVV
jgi:hypothetical protein